MPRKNTNITLDFRYKGNRYTVTAPTRDEALMRKALKMKEIDEGYIKYDDRITVKTWIEEWITNYKEGVVNSAWLRDVKGYCNNYILPNIGDKPIGEVKALMLQKIINSNVKSKSFNDKLYVIIKEIFKKAYENDILPKDITKTLNGDKTKTYQKRRALTSEEKGLLLKALENHRGKLFCYLMLYAGLRPSECAALMWEDVDLIKREIHIQRALKSDGVIKKETKTKSGNRIIPIQNALFQVLKVSKKDSGFVCTNSNGGQLNKKTIFSVWKNIRREMNIVNGAKIYRNKIVVDTIPKDLTLYNLRHTFCTDLQAAGVPINVAKELMGHSSIEMTAKIYTHHSEGSYMEALNKMNSLWE